MPHYQHPAEEIDEATRQRVRDALGRWPQVAERPGFVVLEIAPNEFQQLTQALQPQPKETEMPSTNAKMTQRDHALHAMYIGVGDTPGGTPLTLAQINQAVAGKPNSNASRWTRQLAEAGLARRLDDGTWTTTDAGDEYVLRFGKADDELVDAVEDVVDVLVERGEVAQDEGKDAVTACGSTVAVVRAISLLEPKWTAKETVAVLDHLGIHAAPATVRTQLGWGRSHRAAPAQLSRAAARTLNHARQAVA